MEKIPAEPVIRRVVEEEQEIRDFIHNGFSRYGEQCDVILNYDGFCFVAKSNDGKIAGVITGRAYYNEVHIEDLIVDETYRRTGLGTRLVGTVEDAYKGKGYDIVTLTTFGFQAPEFYRKLGYRTEFIREAGNKKLNKYFLNKKL